jgi:hypothetical protein
MSGAIPPLPQYAVMAWCLVKAQGLYFTLVLCVLGTEIFQQKQLSVYSRFCDTLCCIKIHCVHRSRFCLHTVHILLHCHLYSSTWPAFEVPVVDVPKLLKVKCEQRFSHLWNQYRSLRICYFYTLVTWMFYCFQSSCKSVHRIRLCNILWCKCLHFTPLHCRLGACVLLRIFLA